MTQTIYKILFNVRGYVRNNWGSPFIIVFMLLLISVGVTLSMGLYYQANDIAVYAFYALVIGVILQLLCFLKVPKKDREAETI